MTVLMTKTFARFARKAGLTDVSLAKAAVEVAAGEFDADLGGHSFFAHGFAKNEKANVTAKELKALRKLAEVLLTLSDADIDKGITAGEFVKVEDGDEAQES